MTRTPGRPPARPSPAASGPAASGPAPVGNAPSGPQPAGLDREAVPPAAVRRRVHLVGNTHIDPVWLWTWQEGYQEARATYWSALHRMDEYDDFVFTCDQVVLLAWVKEQDPALFEGIRRRVAEGRWVNVGGWWVEPDNNMPMGESFARQGLYGQRFLLAEFGRATTVGMNVDPFGHNVMLPAILRGHGLDTYTFLRPGPHESDLPRTPFWWEAPDGSRVLAMRIPNEYCAPRGDLSGTIEKGLGQLDLGFDPLIVFYGVGNHGGGPTRANLDSIRRYARMGTFGRLVMSTPRAFFDEVLARGDADALPVWRDDLQHHAAGCYSAHSGIKAWQRRAQHAVLAAERWGAASALLGGGGGGNPALAYPAGDLEQAWKQVLFNQFHDILPGSAVEDAYTDARDALGEAVSISKRITTRAHNVLARQIDIPFVEGVQPVVVFNAHPWPVSALVELNYGNQPLGVHVVDADGTVLPHQAVRSTSTTNDAARGATVFPVELPPFGYALHHVLPVARPVATALTASGGDGVPWVLENDHLRVEVDPATGWLSSLLHKETGLDPVAGARGPHIALAEDPTDTWGHRVVSYAWPGADMPVTRTSLVETGPVRATLRVERAWGRSTLVEEFVLGCHDDALTVRVTIDWRERAHLLKLRFPVAVEDPAGTYEIPYGTLERPVDAAEEPGQSWVDLSGTLADGRRAGLAVVNDAKHGYDTAPAGHPEPGTSPSIGITAVRSAVYAWHDPRLLDGDATYPVQDQGVQRFTVLLVPHAGDWRAARLTRRALELGTRPRAQLESYHDGVLPPRLSLASASEGVLVTAIKGAEDAAPDGSGHDLVVRAVESDGRGTSAVIDLPLVGRRLHATFGPYQLRTFVVPQDAGRPVVEVDLVERPLDAQEGFTDEPVDRVHRFADGPLTMTAPSSPRR